MSDYRIKILTATLCCAVILITGGCGIVITPQLTSQQRQADIEFLAQWAQDQSPIADLALQHNENYPNYHDLLPQYMRYAYEAQSNEDFLRIARNYYYLICPRGHRELLTEDAIAGGKIATLLGIIDLGVSPLAADKAMYWTQLADNMAPDIFHPPIDIKREKNKYFITKNWQKNDINVPSGSEIIKVNGMSCDNYIKYLKNKTPLRYYDYRVKLYAENHLAGCQRK
ncbi:MAG: hypothetical protein FVQ79_10500 [Planctomycetes bacterium]|nr:hypothetical protein [Planctomycetota bacterium]